MTRYGLPTQRPLLLACSRIEDKCLVNQLHFCMTDDHSVPCPLLNSLPLSLLSPSLFGCSHQALNKGRADDGPTKDIIPEIPIQSVMWLSLYEMKIASSD